MLTPLFYVTLSVDRVNSNDGYVKTNIVLCLDSINTMKNTLDLNDFYMVIDNLYNNKSTTFSNLKSNFNIIL